MAEQKEPKSGRLRRWRERWRAERDRAREMQRRANQRHGAESRNPRRDNVSGPGSGGGV
jgi:hypothetical protein